MTISNPLDAAKTRSICSEVALAKMASCSMPCPEHPERAVMEKSVEVSKRVADLDVIIWNS
jgi:hypothetical protein